jgi:hypothetical protein
MYAFTGCKALSQTPSMLAAVVTVYTVAVFRQKHRGVLATVQSSTTQLTGNENCKTRLIAFNAVQAMVINYMVTTIAAIVEAESLWPA